MSISHSLTRTQIDAMAVEEIIEAVSAMDVARRGLDHDHFTVAQSHLGLVVQRVNEQGLSWQSIGDVLGIARGNAYQRYRRRPEPRPQGSPGPRGPVSSSYDPLIIAPTAPAVTPPGP